MLSGPIEVEGAEPGDLLVVDILDLGPCRPAGVGDAPGQGWGYTGIFAKANGGGFLTDHFPDAYKAIWDFHGQDATSRHVPGVRYTGITHPGCSAPRPSAELLAEWNRREQALIDTDPDRVPPLALPPLERQRARRHAPTGERAEPRSRREGARTVPARENGGNHDIKNFTRGQPRLLPRPRRRAPSSRAATCTSARATARSPSAARSRWAASSTSRVDLIKGGMEKYGVTTNPVFMPGRVEPRYTEFLTFIGISVDETTGHEPLPRRHAGLPPGLPERHRVPQEVRLHGRAGLPAARLGADRGPDQRGRRHPERVLLALPADGDLRLRHPAERRRPAASRPRFSCEAS